MEGSTDEQIRVAIAIDVTRRGHTEAERVRRDLAGGGPGCARAQPARRAKVEVRLARESSVAIGSHDHVRVAVAIDVTRTRQGLAEPRHRLASGRPRGAPA